MSTSNSLTSDEHESWVRAQALWGVHLHDPVLKNAANMGTFAWFSFPPQVQFDLDAARKLHVDGFLESLFAHEIGHHTLSPSTRLTELKLVQQMARAITASAPFDGVDVQHVAHDFSNIWSDMLINTRVARMQRDRDAGTGDPEMVRMWQVLSRKSTTDRLWWVVLRAYELLWYKPEGFLCGMEPPAGEDSNDPVLDAGFLADAIRTFGSDPVSGALRFGMIAAPYIVGPKQQPGFPCGGDTDAAPATAGELVQVLGDPRLQESPQHPALAGAPTPGDAPGPGDAPSPGDGKPAKAGGVSPLSGQGYGLAETLALYASSEQAAVIAAWYEAAASRWVRPYLQPSRVESSFDDTIPGAIEEWGIDDEIEAIDWPATLAQGVTVIPGVTTRRRDRLPDSPPDQTESVELDLYIDSSGSMLSPMQESPAVLAGTIIILSVLRGGGRVRVTSFSGAGAVAGGARFGRDRAAAMADLCTYFGGGTVFPLDLYGARYAGLRLDPTHRRHVVVLSDDGLMSMFGEGQSQYSAVASAVRAVLDTATLIIQDAGGRVDAPARAAGYDVEHIASMAEAPAACAALARRLQDRSMQGAARG